MNLTVGYIPYLNMVPFHQGFGPDPIHSGGISIQFRSVSPRILGFEAEAGRIDAGAMSLMDTFRLSDRYEALGNFGIGAKRAAGSVLLFSKRPLADIEGLCAVTDETSTSVRLLEVLLEKRYKRTGVSYGRIASGMYDGSANALLLIGDEALQARRKGVKGLPVVTDLATEWFEWQHNPFVFARWVVRNDAPEKVKDLLCGYLEKSLNTAILNRLELAGFYRIKADLSGEDLNDYWDGFDYKLDTLHMHAIKMFKNLAETVCLTA
jgi:chorismate dehydratase